MDIKLVEVVRENFKEVIELSVKKEQEAFITSNLYSIAESRFSPLTHLRAICSVGRIVGFLEYEFGESEVDKDDCTIWRFMIDQKHQSSGVGRAALGVLLEEIRAYQRCKFVDVYYCPQNIAAKKLYASYGFKEVGDRDDGTIIAELKL
jgi:diamine N-acetyltransferase